MEERNSWALALAITASTIWGVLPVYWKFFEAVPAYEVLAHRIFWAFFFMMALVLVTGRLRDLAAELRLVAVNRRKLLTLLAGSVFISFNWLTFIWAVNHDLVVESSLGYYISPLFQVLVGVAVFRERLSLWQFLAVVLAAAGVIHLTFSYGSLLIVPLFLAASFTVYGCCKKVIGLSAVSGMTLETALIAPLAGLFLLNLYARGQGSPAGLNQTFLLLLGTGAVTVIPLIMFSHSLRRLPLSLMGFLQYLSPTLTLLLGVFLYHEVFSHGHLIAFGFIWSGCALFAAAGLKPMVRLERFLLHHLNRLAR